MAEQRLIDANALIAQIEENICKPCIERKEDYNRVRCRACQYGDEIDDIDSAPTIEEWKMGKWIWVTEDKYRCSECNQETRVDEIMGVPMYACCPYCKADMTDYDGNVLYKR